MAKYRNYSKKILAIVLVLATVLTTGSFNMEALAKGYSDAPNDGIPSGGYIGQISANGEATNQQVNNISFKIVKEAGKTYICTADIYENPTDENDPESGVHRAYIEKDVEASQTQEEATIDIPVSLGDDSKPIVLTPGEKVGVAINILSFSENPTLFYDSDEGTGFTKASFTSSWVSRENGTMLIDTSTYTGTLSDITSITMSPEKTILTVGDDPVDLNVKIDPLYKRTINITSNNPSAVTIDNQKAVMAGSGEAKVTATCAGQSTDVTFKVLDPKVNNSDPKQIADQDYTGTAVTPDVKLYLGTTELVKDTDYVVNYKNNINPGTATIEISGRGNYQGYNKSYDFKIVKGKLTDEMVQAGEYTVNTATGEVSSASITGLTYNVDYEATAEYKSSTQTSVTYDVSVKGIGNYDGGPFTKEVTMQGSQGSPLDINAVVIAELDKTSYEYTGSDITPQVHFYSRTATGKGEEIPTFKNNVEVIYPSDSSASTTQKTVTITGIADNGYVGTIELNYTITPLNIGKSGSGVTVTVAKEPGRTDNKWTHTGSEIIPGVTVKLTKGEVTKNLNEGTDYTLKYRNNTDIGTARITVSGKGNYSGSINEEFEIIASFKNDAEVTLGGYTTDASRDFVTGYSVAYNGNAHEPTLSITLDGDPIEYGTDYTISYVDNTDAGTAKVHVTGQGIYSGSEFDVKYTITKKQLSGSVVVSQPTYTYTGTAISLPDGAYDVYDGSKRLTPGVDYDVAFSNNTNVGTARVTATGKGNYQGSINGSYTIEALSLQSSDVTIDAIPDESYTGGEHRPVPVVRLNGNAIDSSNYTVTYANNIAVGTATVTITGKNNFKDTKQTTFKINPKTLNGLTLTYTLGGLTCTPTSDARTSYVAEYSASYNGLYQRPPVQVSDGGVLLTEGTDYRVTYSGNLNAGTASANIIGLGGYKGSGVGITFTITKKSLTNCVVNFSGATEKRIDGKTYPIVEVRDPSASYGKDLLVENVDYTLVPEEAAATSGSNRKCSIVGKEPNYMDEQEVYYDVGNNIASGTVLLYLPDGSQIQKTGDQYLVEYMGETPPKVNVTYDGKALTEHTDYEVAFTPVSGTLYDAGSVVKVTVTGKGEYYGEATEQYSVTRKAIDTITLTDGNNTKTSDWIYVYNNLKKEVNPVLTYNVPGVATPIVLTLGTDFTVDKTEIGPNVTDSEIVTITATATGNYVGTRTADYKINPFNINDIDDIIIDPIADQKYTASAITPSVTVRHKLSDTSTIEIDPRSGYDVTYQNNTDVGEATVVITGKNNYYGTNTSRKFNIVRRPLTEDNTTITGLDNVFYDGTAKEPDITVIYAEPGTSGILLTEGEDYTVTYSDNTKIGPADKSGPKVHITGIGKYDGTVIEGFAIKGNIADTTIFTITGINDEYTISNGTITGITPLVTYKPGGVVTEIPSTYYTLKPPSTITPGNATVALEGNGDVMAGTYYKNIVLKGNLSEAGAVTITGFDAAYDYTGSEIKPHPTVTYNGRTLVEGTDYKLEWQDNTNPGTAKVVVKPADGNTFYVGQASATFNIKYNLANATISGIKSSYEYKGSAWEPAPSVTIGTTTLSLGTDYEVTYANNLNVGTATLTITAPSGSETTKGSKATTFKITPIAINNSNTTVLFDPAEIEFTGQPLQPLPTVKYNGQQLTINEDYLVEWPLDNKPGVKNVTVRGTGNYIGNVTNGQYTITPADISKATINVEDADYAGGQPVIPNYTISYNGIDLIKDGDYTVTCSNNEQVGTATITFTGKGCFTGSTTINFNVQQTDLSKGTVKVDGNSSIYTGSAIKPNIEVYIYTGDGDKKYTLKEKTSENPNGDYTISYNGFDEMVDAGDYEIIVQGEGNFVNKLYAAYKVEPKSLASDDIEISLDKENWDYTGEEVKPSVVVKDTTRNVDLEPGVDYEIEYLNNTKAASKDGENAPTVRITGKGNYGEVVDKTFNIGSSLESATVTLSQYNYVYDGTEHKPTALAVLGTKDLVQGEDFELKYSPDDLIHVGEKTATLTGINGYYGEIPVTYNVNKKTASKDEIKIVLDYDKDEEGNYITVYNGKAKEPNVVVYDTTISEETPMLTSDYTVTYEHNTDVSTEENPAIVRVNLQGNYDKGLDEFNQKFYIKEKTLDSGFEVAFKEHTTQYPYTGSAVEPEVEVIPTLPELVGKELVKDTDYTVEYTNNVNAGEATAIIKGIGNYSGVVEKKFNVVASFADADIQVEDQFYTGTEVKAPLNITCGGNTLVLGEDYDVNYWSDNNWETSATATITPLKPWYSGSARNVDYNIVFDPTMLTVSGYNNEYAYTGNPIKPDFVVSTPSGTSISYDPDAIKYVNSKTGEGDCTSIGTITATIPLNVGSKTCEVTATYDIIGKNINLCHIVPLYDNVYTGSKIYPPVLIWTKNPDGSLGELLTEGVDYTLKYSDNVNPGVGKIEITGIGNYIATVTKYFNIIAPDVLSLSGSALSDTSVRLNWLRNAHITGYEIYSEDSSVKYDSTTGTSFDIGSLKQATNYTFKVRTFITVDGKTTYGAFKTVTVRTGLSAPTITVQSLARKRTTLNWTPAENVTGYEIYRSVSLNGTYNKIAVMPQSAGGYSDSNLVSRGTYYYKVRAYLKVGENQFVYGYFSAPKAVTVK
ncbi:MAG: fibronectin type III domain-containing protein [Lachnospiraceae bacterium]|nr:fibronectin type III domain-containing protein [Lachnospiraceae bacterium]